MIIHKLIAHHLGHRDDAEFYKLQADDALRWLEKRGVRIVPGMRVLDLGAGHGIFGINLLQRGCHVTFADQHCRLLPEIPGTLFREFRIGDDDLETLGQYDLAIISNVLEHLPNPIALLDSLHHLLAPGGRAFLSWTNWLSPWGGHEFSPFHYFGSRWGHLIHDRIMKRDRLHTPYENLFPTYIGHILRHLRSSPNVSIDAVAPRYYSELGIIAQLPIIREFLTWNCMLLIRRLMSPNLGLSGGLDCREEKEEVEK